jgi:predicted DNA-binding transcriptional regulator AlpA
MENQTDDRIRTRKEVADRLRISLRTLTRMESRGKLPPRIKITDRIFGYRDSSINQFLASRVEGQ